MKNIDKYRGCLIGGAVGDALGYAVEFMSEGEIFSKYGINGITEYELVNDVARISDDTQMTMFTANGLLFTATRGKLRGIAAGVECYIADFYRDWYFTQIMSFSEYKKTKNINECETSWLINVPELFCARAPGNTCLSAILSGKRGSIEEPINNSKGCGGVMRVAPIGLYYDISDEYLGETDMDGARVAALTHGHELGYIPAAALVHIIQLVAHREISVKEAVISAIEKTAELFVNAKHIKYFTALMNKAVRLAETEIDNLKAIHSLGEGWVAEETLAIAVYCAIKYSENFEKAIITSVNHSGDSDSTGAVTGNILGAYLGFERIPKRFVDKLELKDIIIELADDLYNDCKLDWYSNKHDEIWEHKYLYHDYILIKEKEK